MKQEKDRDQISSDVRVRRKILGWKDFLITFVILLLLAGVQMGLIVLFASFPTSEFIQINTIILYWAMVAFLFCVITRQQIKKGYDIPMRKLSTAAKQVAEGDFSVYVQPIHTADRYDYIDVMFTDFNIMVQELGSIETLKNDFVANVSHEIKTPLAVIKNYTTMLRNENIDHKTRDECIDTITKATDNLSSLVTNILRLNKLDNQERDTAVKQYDLCAQLSDCVFAFDALLDDKNIEFEADIEDRAVITTNRDMLEIVWNNLFSNALKFTPKNGKIFLKQRSESDVITVSVTDTGCGIDEESIKHIFDKFYQADTSHSGEGNGLGLALCMRIIEKWGGTLTVQSKLGIGSTFTVTLPIGN